MSATPLPAGPPPAGRAGTASAAPATETGEAAWSAAAAAVLRKAGRLATEAADSEAWSRLARTTLEGLTIPPLGTASRVAHLPANGLPGQAPYLRGTRVPDGSGWDVRALVTDPDPGSANAALLADLENGVTSIWVTVGGAGTSPADLDAALAEVYLDMAPIALGPAGAVSDRAAAEAFQALCAVRDVRPHPASNLGADPIGRAVRGRSIMTDLSDIGEIAALATALGVRGFVVDGSAAHEAGAGDAAEIGYVLATGAAYLRAMSAAGLGIDAACALLEARFAVTDDQFVSIAKLRAARLTWHRLLELCGAAAPSRGQRQHAVTSPVMLTRYDPWVNLLRTTVSAFAAGVGGAESITVLPFDAALGVPDAFGRRLARNISTLLVHESHVAKTVDPAGGAHAVEMLTSEIADAAWAEFQRIEASGGISAALADGSWSARADALATQRRRRIATRRQPITGVSEFPSGGEVLPDRAGTPLTEGVARWATPFEDLRDTPATEPVVIVPVGDRGQASARTLFVENLLAAGGIRTVHDETGTRGTLSGRDAIIVGTDDAYAANGADAVSWARQEGARRVFVAGRTPDSMRDLVDGQVAAGEDVLGFLRRLRDEIGASA